MNQQSDRSDPTLAQKAEIMTNIMIYPALTVMVFLRRDLGYRMVNPKWLTGVTLVEIVIAMIFHPRIGGPNALFFFAVTAFAFGMTQRFKRWKEFNRGVKQHSFYIGTSCFESPKLPEFLRRNRRIARTADPILCVLVGVYCWRYFPALGFWLFLSGMCLAGFEGDVHRRDRNQTLDMVDSIIVSEVQSDTIEEFEEAPNATPQEPAPGIPAGLGDDIHDHLKRRQPKRPMPQKGV
jgi:hypothetical protein